MNVAAAASSQIEGFAVEEGIGKSMRIARVQVPPEMVESEDASGNRRVRNGFFSKSLDKIVGQRLKEYVTSTGTAVFPHIEPIYYVDPTEPGGNYEGVYAFEVRPTIVLPDLGGHEIKVPEPDVGGDFYAKLIADLPSKMPEWKDSDAACASGDRLMLVSQSPSGNSEPMPYWLQEGRDPHLHELFVGARVGESRTIPESGIAVRIVKIEKPQVAELNLEFIQKIEPECKSLEQFEESFRKMHASHMQQMITKVMMRRCEDLLDRTAEPFELPQFELTGELLNWRQSMAKRGGRDFLANVGERGLAEVMQRIESGMRRRMLIQEYVLVNRLLPDEAEIDAYLDAMSVQYEDPKLFKQRFKADKQSMDQVRSQVSMSKFCDLVIDRARNVAETMSFAQLEKMIERIDAGEAIDLPPSANPEQG